MFLISRWRWAGLSFTERTPAFTPAVVQEGAGSRKTREACIHPALHRDPIGDVYCAVCAADLTE